MGKIPNFELHQLKAISRVIICILCKLLLLPNNYEQLQKLSKENKGHQAGLKGNKHLFRLAAVTAPKIIAGFFSR